MRYELWLSMRYLLAKRRERFVSVISVLSIGGVALGVAALLVVLAVMSGFDYDLKEKLVGANAHVVIEADQGLRDIEPLMRQVAGTEHVVGVTPFIVGQAIVRMPARPVSMAGAGGPDRAFGVAVRGLDPARERHVSRWPDYIVVGHLPSTDEEAMIGVELARFLGLTPGERLELLSPADGTRHELVISGLFRSGMYEYDANLVGITIPRAQRLFGLEGVVNGLGVRLDALERAEAMREQLAAAVGPAYTVKTWMQLNQTLFDALKLEKLTMFVILTLIVLVAAVNIVSTLIMMVTEKTRDIGILKSIGASSRSVARIFTWQGLIIGLAGTALGVAGAWVLIWLLQTTELIRLPSSIYYLDHLPARVEWGDWARVISASMAISLLATIYPAHQAAKLAPVDALRYE